MRTLFSIALLLSTLILNATKIFYYSPQDGNGGLRFAIEQPDGKWKEIGHNFNFVSSDFGAWGSGKKMFNPLLVPDGNGWKIVFSVNKNATVYGIADSPDLMSWQPQEYVSPENLPYKDVMLAPENTIKLGRHKVHGRIITIEDSLAMKLNDYVKDRNRLGRLYAERCDSDDYRFNGLEKIKGTLTVSSQSKEISPLLLGIFFEDINYSADGGLYAELIQNRDFEYRSGENGNKEWGPKFGWTKHGKTMHFDIKNENPISANNPHYARLTIVETHHNNSHLDGLFNEGYDGITLKKGESYRFSVKARSNVNMPVAIELISHDKKVIASAAITVKPGIQWEDYEAILPVSKDYSKASLRILPGNKGELDLDMVSLFPVNTYKGRKNGLRPDLAQTLADLKPRFVRFPGGCVAHGNGIDNMYDWKGSIGPLENRKPLSNLWGYHQTRGLGYHEYFLFCEDIGAEPVPVLAAGVPCQNSSTPSRFTTDDLTHYGQQQGIPMDSLQTYIQDILDLIEYANGPINSTWGSKRAAAGHPESFNLKYIGIGNEDMITEVFKERFEVMNNAIKKAYPEITVIGTTGPFYEGADYEEGWNFARQQNVDMVDEHYYVQPSWLIYNQDFYDNYDREGPKVYLGEWASHLPDRSSNMETALSEALYITALEKNADIVRMSSYAPLLAKKNHTQWRPDLIYFDNDSIYPTTDYHVMRLAGENAGDRYVMNSLKINNDNDKVKARIGASVVTDSESGDTIIKLVNLLPVNTELVIDLTEWLSSGVSQSKNIKKTIMKGSPDQDKAQISHSEDNFDSSTITVTLPEYSFTILRI